MDHTQHDGWGPMSARIRLSGVPDVLSFEDAIRDVSNKEAVTVSLGLNGQKHFAIV